MPLRDDFSETAKVWADTGMFVAAVNCDSVEGKKRGIIGGSCRSRKEKKKKTCYRYRSAEYSVVAPGISPGNRIISKVVILLQVNHVDLPPIVGNNIHHSTY